MITIENLSDIFALFMQGVTIGGLLSGLVWIVAYTVKKCIGFFR